MYLEIVVAEFMLKWKNDNDGCYWNNQRDVVSVGIRRHAENKTGVIYLWREKLQTVLTAMYVAITMRKQTRCDTLEFFVIYLGDVWWWILHTCVRLRFLVWFLLSGISFRVVFIRNVHVLEMMMAWWRRHVSRVWEILHIVVPILTKAIVDY